MLGSLSVAETITFPIGSQYSVSSSDRRNSSNHRLRAPSSCRPRSWRAGSGERRTVDVPAVVGPVLTESLVMTCTDVDLAHEASDRLPYRLAGDFRKFSVQFRLSFQMPLLRPPSLIRGRARGCLRRGHGGGGVGTSMTRPAVRLRISESATRSRPVRPSTRPVARVPRR